MKLLEKRINKYLSFEKIETFAEFLYMALMKTVNLVFC